VIAGEAQALDRVGAANIAAFEPGNEPELYGIFTWDGSGIKGRPRDYDFSAFTSDFTRLGGVALSREPLAGPAIGAPKWFSHLGSFLSAEPHVRIATLHRYPLQVCFVNPRLPNYPTIANLLSDRSSRTMADSVSREVAAAHARGVPVRIDEMNTISCGNMASVAQSFASALWALDALFEMARVGVDGVNMHTYPGATYELFTFDRVNGRWVGSVAPEYYGLLMFAQAAPPGSRLEPVSQTGPHGLKAWATQSPDGTVRVVLINEQTGARPVMLQAPASGASASVLELRAASLTARGGVTLGGMSFGSRTATGVLSGAPKEQTLRPAGGDYVFDVPGASAVMVTIPPRAG
jgi:hypothetical protein